LGALAELRIDGKIANCAGDESRFYDAALRATELAPQSTSAQLGLAAAEVQVQRYHAARRRYEAIDPLRLPPTFERRYYSGATFVLHVLGDYQAELALARSALARYPDNVATVYALTMPLAALGREAELETALERSRTERVSEAFMRAAAIRNLRYHGHDAESRRLIASAGRAVAADRRGDVRSALQRALCARTVRRGARRARHGAAGSERPVAARRRLRACGRHDGCAARPGGPGVTRHGPPGTAR